MSDLEELVKRLRDIAENGWTQDGEECMFLASIAAALETLQRENAILRAERDQARAQHSFCVKVLMRIHSFIPPEGVVLPDGRRFEFNNPAIEHEMLKALGAAIRAIPDELKKAENAQVED